MAQKHTLLPLKLLANLVLLCCAAIAALAQISAADNYIAHAPSAAADAPAPPPSPADKLAAELAEVGGPPCFSYVFAFGDSTTDTGNAVRTGKPAVYGVAEHLPYGSTFFERPTGRFSDGRLMVDWLCESYHTPLLPAHLDVEAATAAGRTLRSENFAVAGATALDILTLQRLANVTSTTPYSLEAQVKWFLSDIAGASAENLSQALVYLGEIGGNDYNYAFVGSQKPASEVAELVPEVVNRIASQLERILQSGVKEVLVQGQFPMGCLSVYLHQRRPGSALDEHGCIADVNAVSDLHNSLLRSALNATAARHLDVNIVFFDSTVAYLHVLKRGSDYGFTNGRDPCFTAGIARLVGNATDTGDASSTTACPDPQHYLSWDGIHMTEAMYGVLMGLFLHGGSRFASPSPNFLDSLYCIHA